MPKAALITHCNAYRFIRWIAPLLVLAMLGQALLPTFALLRSNSNPALWEEICSVYGPRQVRSILSDQDKKPTNSQHADCPLCLHIVSDVILATPLPAPVLHALLLNTLDVTVITRSLVSQRIAIPEARAPPHLN